jgi:hypothetical protein
MPNTKEYTYYGTNPVMRVGGDNTLSAVDAEVTGNGRGRISGAGWRIGKVDQFGGSATQSVRFKHFVERSTRRELDAFVSRQRIDLFNRNQRRPHDLFHSYRPGDYEWVALAPEETDVDTESLALAPIVPSGTNTREIILGDLSMWTQDETKTGSWSLYRESNTDSYIHQVPAGNTHAALNGSTELNFMGWFRSTASSAVQTLIRKQGCLNITIASGVISITYNGTGPVTFSNITFPLANNRWYFIGITVKTNVAILHVAGDWETSFVTDSGALTPGAGSDANPMYVGSDSAGDDGFVGYMGSMVITDKALSSAQLLVEFNLTKNGLVPFTDTADWAATYGVTPTKALYWNMERVRDFEAFDNLMLTKVYNTFGLNSVPTNGAIKLDHGTLITSLDALFVDTALRAGLGDRLFLGNLDDFTDDIGYSDDSEIVWVRRKEIARLPTTVYDDRRIEIKPVAIPRDPPEGFRADHKNGQSLVIKFRERYPMALPDDIVPEQVTGLQRGRMREVDYGFQCERFPFHDIDAQNYDNALDLQYIAFPP